MKSNSRFKGDSKSEPQIVRNRPLWSHFLVRIIHPESVCETATWELALNLTLKETNIFSHTTFALHHKMYIMDEKRHLKDFQMEMNKLQKKYPKTEQLTYIALWYHCSHKTHMTVFLCLPSLKSRRGDILKQLSVSRNFFYISIHGIDIDLRSATQWAPTAGLTQHKRRIFLLR